MKTLIVLSSLVLTSALTFAQFDKGTKWTGLNLYGYATSSVSELPFSMDSDELTSQVFQISPRFGYFLSDKFAIGVGRTFGIGKYDYKSITGWGNYSPSRVCWKSFRT